MMANETVDEVETKKAELTAEEVEVPGNGQSRCPEEPHLTRLNDDSADLNSIMALLAC